MQAIAQGEHMCPELRNADPAPENGLGQPAADGEAGPAIEGTAKPNLNYLFTLQLGPGQSSNSLRQIGEEEGTECGEYAWNWNKLGGGLPWKNADQDLLLISDKTHLLRNAYAANIKRAVQSLEAQRNIPDFPPILWRKVLANWPVDFRALLEDQYSNTTTFNDSINLGEGFELTTKKPAKPRTKILNHSQWMYAWSKYKTAVTWAFPHRMAELSMYEKHIIRRFNSDLDPTLCIQYDQAAHKFLFANQLAFSEMSLLSNLSQEIFLPHTGGIRQSDNQPSGGLNSNPLQAGK